MDWWKKGLRARIACDYRLHVLARAISECNLYAVLDEDGHLWDKLGEAECHAAHPFAVYSVSGAARLTLLELAEETPGCGSIVRHLLDDRGFPAPSVTRPTEKSSLLEDVYDILAVAVASGTPSLDETVLCGLPEYMWGGLLFEAVRSQCPCVRLVERLAERLAERSAVADLARAMCAAACTDRVELVRVLFSFQPKFVMLDALCVAAHSGCLNVVRFLVDRGADAFTGEGFELFGEAGFTPFALACTASSPELVNYLLDVAPVGFSDADALSNAVRLEDISTVRILLQKQQQDLNRTDRAGNTALHYAATGCPAILAELLSCASVDLEVVNAKGETALDVALFYAKSFPLCSVNAARIKQRQA